ncbi:hypothetical protein ATK30_3764 [Amycolatopsis echigonensis]|uniref:Uncharacterized protein n=1 Tax=Amycolatopsis echigonensis TaxID=2576905 RepID=A0A2N3WGF3_9PSEU|nr:hypothetical protein [Amycolatopsis niigatensis]PKV92932.1 hypothetical protein ATK30_3764 [Amycolatopsis niigatensis]
MAEHATPPGDTGAIGMLTGASFFVADGPAGGGGASGGGGAPGFYLSKEAMTAELTNLQNLQTRIDSQIEKAVPMWSIVPPGKDPASLRNTDASNNSGNYYRGHLMRQSAYLGSVIQKMKDALGIHDAHDQQAGKDITKQGEGHF